MHQKPSVQNLVKAALLVELAFLFADVFEIVQIRVQCRRQQDAKLAEQSRGYRSVFQTDAMASRLFEIGTYFALRERDATRRSLARPPADRKQP